MPARPTSTVLGSLALASALAAGLAAAGPAAAGPTAPSVAKPAYSIGFQGPLSGPDRQFGVNIGDGAQLAVNQANARGSLPFTLTLRRADDVGDPSRAPAAARLLIANPQVLGVVGPAFSGAAQATGAQYARAGLGTVSPSATNPALARYGWQTFHRVIATDTVEEQSVADWLHRRKVHSLAVVSDGTSYGSTSRSSVAQRAKALHLKVVRYTTMTAASYRTVAARIKKAKLKAVYFGGYDATAAPLAKALHTIHYQGLRVGSNGIFSPVFTRNAGTSGLGWYATCGCLTAYSTAAQKAFVAAYRSTFHQAPGEYSAQGYDATNAMIRALTAAVSSGHPTRSAVNAALGKVTFTGISTPVRFTGAGELVSSVARINLFQDRARRFVQLGDIRPRH